METKHKQVEIEVDEDLVITADEEIAPLIKNLWDCGMITTRSCQNHHGDIWIEFLHSEDLRDFVAIVYEEPATSYKTRKRILGRGNIKDSWGYGARPYLNEDNGIDIRFSVFFPPRDYDLMLYLIQKHAEERGEMLKRLQEEVGPDMKISPLINLDGF